jgi:thioredoxin reductase
MLESWLNAISAAGVRVNEEESCTDIKRQEGFFIVSAERGKRKERVTYKSRRVILAIGNRGAPMKLGVTGEDLKLRVTGGPERGSQCPKCGVALPAKAQRFCVMCGASLPSVESLLYEDPKVKYKLSDPDDYAGKRCMVVGAGNSAIEAAVDLCGFKRQGDQFTFTRDNEVTLVIRSDFKGDLKLPTKMNIYDCIDAGRVKVFFRAEIKEIREKEVVLMEVRTKKELARIPNDYVFALIGGEKPTKFLESIGIKIG